jgi:DNA polymerase-1
MELCIDIEANGLLYESDRIWMVCAVDDDGGWHVYLDQPISASLLPKPCSLYNKDQFIDLMYNADTVIAHNLYGYDLPLMMKLWDVDPNQITGNDTAVMSSLFDPDIAGGHSLKAWGNRFGLYKGDHNEWDRFSPEMFTYCIRDVEVLDKLWRKLKHDMELD